MSTHHIDTILNEHSDNGMKRNLSAANLVLLGVGGVIGAGIFVLTGQAAANYAGPAIVLSFIISAIGCVFAALCYSEMAAMIPLAGSAYTYAYSTMGRFIAWIIGWDLILEYLFGASTVAVGWSGYLVSFLKDFDIIFPASFASSPLSYSTTDGWSTTGAILNLPAALICLVCTILMVIGTKQSATFNNIIVFIKVAVIITFIVAGASYIDTSNYTPFIPAADGNGHFGWGGIFTGAGVIFFAYIGFDALSTLAQEAKNPQRDMPIGIIGSLLICTVLYISVALVMTGLVKYTELNTAAPIAVAIDAAGAGLNWLKPLIKLAAVAGLSSVVLVLLLGQPRIFYAMSKDGLLPKVFSKIHPKFGTPYIPTILTGIIAAIVAGIFPIGILGELVSIGTLLAFIIVCAGVWILRHTQPDRPRPFRCPMVPLFPILGILVSLSQMIALPHDTWMRLIIWMGLGMIIYYAYGRKETLRQ